MGFVKGVYVFAMGVLLTLLVAFGISTFYEGPKLEPGQPPPVRVKEFPPATPTSIDVNSPEYQKYLEEQRKFAEEETARFEKWQAARKVYHRNVLFAAYPWGLLLIFLGSIQQLIKVGIIRAGLMLGGMGTMVYAVVQGGGDLGNLTRFLAIAIGLAALISVGFRELEARTGKANNSGTGEP